MMELDTEAMRQYADFLEDFSQRIVTLCRGMEELTAYATQCMDQDSGRRAAVRLDANMENIIRNVPISDDACQRLIQALRMVDQAKNIL